MFIMHPRIQPIMHTFFAVFQRGKYYIFSSHGRNCAGKELDICRVFSSNGIHRSNVAVFFGSVAMFEIVLNRFLSVLWVVCVGIVLNWLA